MKKFLVREEQYLLWVLASRTKKFFASLELAKTYLLGEGYTRKKRGDWEIPALQKTAQIFRRR